MGKQNPAARLDDAKNHRVILVEAAPQVRPKLPLKEEGSLLICKSSNGIFQLTERVLMTGIVSYGGFAK